MRDTIIAKERQEKVNHSIVGLLNVQRWRKLSPTERAALKALQRVARACAVFRNCTIAERSIARPVGIAARAVELTSCAR